MTDCIAIVSVAGRFPGSGADLDHFWTNIAAAADCSRAVPAGRWVLPPESCADPRIAHPDTVYSTRGYYLDPFDPELSDLDLNPALVAELDPLFHLVLDVGNRAWRGANTDLVDRSRVGVILGNICLPTDKSSDLCREILGEKVGLPESRNAGPVNALNRYVAGLPAGLLARGLRLGGGSYTLDAACASSLYALKLAADELRAGRVDAMLAGGCSRPDCQYTQMGFAQLRALSVAGRCSPFDAAADGLMVGEGAGIFVLKRLADALAHGDRVLAVIAGVGLSNDMHGNLLAPAKEGQLRAMRRAYELAGWKPQDANLIECHATGTAVGDAVEFNSLRELWGEAGWQAGQCAIGSVKSTVGHLLTGAGSAAVAKVILAIKNETLPPQANFTRPAAGLRYAEGPFRVLRQPERWYPKGAARRAAVSGFGFGGVNAHLLLEEWRESKGHPVTTPRTQSDAGPIAIVGLAAQFGSWDDTRKLQEYVLGGTVAEAKPKMNGWAQAREAPPPAFGMEEVHIPIDRFRIPPKELEETLPQQLLMLQVAAAALEDATDAGSKTTEVNAVRTGAFVGLGLDLNTTNFHLRWSCIAAGVPVDHAGPPLTANRTMGALGSIAASRVARAFQFGGPSHTVCSEEASAARAVELGVRALQNGELDCAVVGGVDLACDPRMVLPGAIERPGEGAAAFVLKRLADAERDGDRVYAVIRGIGVASDAEAALRRANFETRGDFDGVIAFDATDDVGHTGAASAGASLAKACLSLRHTILPGNPSHYWLHDRAAGPRRATVNASGSDGTHVAIFLEEHAKGTGDLTATAEREQPLGARAEAVFAVEGDSHAVLIAKLTELYSFAVERTAWNIEAIARNWWQSARQPATRRLAVSLVARSLEELAEQVAFATENLHVAPDLPLPSVAKPTLRDRVFYSPQPLGPNARLAFVYPGSGNQFNGMGRDLSAQWPQLLRRQETESEFLRGQFAPDSLWHGNADEGQPRDLMFGQVAVGALVADLALSLGAKPTAMIGLSLGESAGLFGTRLWRDRDDMFQRMQRSTLFNSDLAPPYNAARAFWRMKPDQRVDWVSGIIAAPPADVQSALRPDRRAFLLIANTPMECVIGGLRDDVMRLAAELDKPINLLTGVTLAHCEVGSAVEESYRKLHTLPVTPAEGITIYSGAWGRRYDPTERNCADSITAGLQNTIDVPTLIEAAYGDGVRAFIEVGPGNSCTRAVDSILAGRPHFVRAAHVSKQDAVSQVLRLVAHLTAERLPVDFAVLYGRETRCVGHREPGARRANEVVIPVGRRPDPPAQPSLPSPDRRQTVHVPHRPYEPVFATALAPAIEAAANVQVLNMQAQQAFLRINDRFARTAANLLQFQTQLLAVSSRQGIPIPELGYELDAPLSVSRPVGDPPRALTYQQCCQFAVGRVGDVLGPLFAEIDEFPTRVRLPDGPLQLVDCITLIEGEPLSLTRGRVVTEHTVQLDRWYLEAGRMPTALSVESGQADLFLSGFLGIDLRTRGLAVYRLLDAVVSFHRSLPQVGETIVYDIRIDEFSQQGDAWIFRFQFDGKIGGEPFITMRNGVAGFFTAAALAAGKGIVRTALDLKAMPGNRPADWRDLVAVRECSLSADQVTALRAGDLRVAFGRDFEHLPLCQPATIPGGMLRLVDRVPLIDPIGGRFGLGLIRAEFDIHPDDWFLTCHFVDDQVMPGTLMYECCLHTLRILLMRTGWVGEDGEVVCEPVPGVNSRLKCRGQVIATTRTVTYEVTVKEIGYRPEPYCLADALMYADDKPIVEITSMSLRMSGLTREKLEGTWARTTAATRPPLYDSASILAFSNGKPSEAFGEPYKVFDSERVIARLPGPPFQFLDRVVGVTGEPFVLKAGAACVAEYDVPTDAWYFEANRAANMPFAVLLEIALQPCGWLAAYCGSALTSQEDLSFRNLGGKATQHRPVTPTSGTLATSVKMTNVSNSAGMIIQHYEMRVRDSHGDVYTGTTYFGFFAKPQLANQIGMPQAKVPWPNEDERRRAESSMLPHDAPFPAPMMRMVDRLEFIPDGGERGLGLVVGRIAVDPTFWFFKAHFYQDPVWPGSLGLESFLQLLKIAAWKRWGKPRHPGWQTVALNCPHAWTYRGQVVPRDREVAVVLEVTAVDDHNRRLTANGFLTVDGRVIYQMTDFTLE